MSVPHRVAIFLSAMLLLAVSLQPAPAEALREYVETEETINQLYVVPYIKDFVDVPKGGVAWELFAQTKQESFQTVTDEGYDLLTVLPEFTDDIRAIDGQEILMQGYMFPLSQASKQTLFLFGPFPNSCPYHYHVGPNLVIEAHTTKENAIDYRSGPINIKGRLELVERDLETGIFYRLRDVRFVSAPHPFFGKLKQNPFFQGVETDVMETDR